MAITPRAVGAWAVSNATTQTVTLPTHVAGDMLIVRTIRKPFTSPDNTVINTAGWNPVGTGVANGATANGNGTGSMGFKAFYKIAASGAETNPVVTWGTTSAPGACVAVSYQKGGSESWITPTGTGGGDATARTSQTSTMSSHISVVSGDLVDFFRGQCDDSGALTVPTITQTGVTFDTVTEYPATAIADGTSNDIAADGGYRTATAGTSSAAAVITGTSAASEEHGAWQTRLRVAAVQDLAPGLIDRTAVAHAPTVYRGYEATVRTDNPVHYWRVGEASGTVVDSGSSPSDGTTTGTVTRDATGLILINDDGAIAPAASGYVSGALSPAIGNVFSLEAWLKLPASGTSFITYFSTKGSASNISVGVARSASAGSNFNVKGYVYDNVGYDNVLVAPDSVVAAGGTYHIVWTRSGTSPASTNKCYVNGVDVGNVSGTTQVVVNTDTTFWIGGFEGATETWVSTIDEVAVYSTELSAARVLAHYQAGRALQTVSPSLITQTATISAPTITTANTIVAGLITQTAVASDPTVSQSTPTQNLTIGVITQTATIAAPKVYLGYSATVMTDAPVGYWRVGEPSGTTATDELGANNATYVTGTTDISLAQTGALGGDSNTAIYIPAISPTLAHVTIPGAIDLVDGPLSIEWWQKPQLIPVESKIFDRVGSGAIQITMLAGQVTLSGGGLAEIVRSTVTETIDNLWHHFVVTKNGAASIKIWRDGVDVTGTVTNQTFTANSGLWRVGRRRDADSEAYRGYVDEIALYSTVLSGARALAHWNAGKTIQGISVGLITQTATISAPTITAGNVNVTPNLITQTATTFTPTITTGNVNVAPNLITQTAVASAPAITTANAISAGLITQTAVAYATRGAATQVAYRFRYDDGDETSATWMAAQNTPVSAPLELIFRLRFEMQETDGLDLDATEADWELQYRINGGSWITSFYEGLDVESNSSAFVNDDDPTTNQLTAGTGTFSPGLIEANQGRVTGSIAAHGHTEFEFVFSLSPDYGLTIDDVVDLRIGPRSPVFSGGPDPAPVELTYTAIATVTVVPITVALGLISQTAATFAPTITGAVNLTLGLITQTATIASPTITQSASVAPNFIDQTATASAPTITAGNVNVTPNLITQTATISAPTITTANTISAGLITQTATISAPTITKLNTISAGLITQTATTFSPTITSVRNLTLGLIAQTASASAPTITTGAVAASVGIIDQTAQPRTPTITTANAISLGLINQTAATFAPSVGTDIALALITQTAATFAPTVTSVATVSVGLISQTATASTPTVTPGATSLLLGLINQTAVAHEPTTTAGGAVVELGLISQTATASSPTITTGAVSVAPNFITQTATISSPSITTANTISFELIDRTATASSPTITTGAAPVSIGLINQTAATFTPTVTTGAVSVTLGLISQVAAASAPTLTTSNSISLGLISQTATANAPSIGPTVTLGLINQTATASAPTITAGAAFVSLGLIDRTAVASAPAVQIISGLELDLITQTAATFTPAITTASTISVAPIDQAATTFAPTIIPGTVELDLGLIAQTAFALEPEIVPTYALPLDLIDQTANAHTPTLVYDQFMVLARINRKAVAYVPYVGPEEVPDPEGGLAYVGGGYYG